MPVYEYRHTEGYGEGCQEVVEIVHSMSEPNYETCPVCHKPIRKMLSRLNSISSEKDKLSDSNLKRNGFSKYVKSSDGTYEKASGPDDAPSTLDRNAIQANLDAMGH